MTDQIQNEHESKVYQRKVQKCLQKTCSMNTVKKILPIVKWLPKYKLEFLIQDFIAGITVGLTAIPQGIAYAVIAGLPPEYGLYGSLTPGFVYVIFGSCADVTIGPTAVISTMTAKYVAGYSPDFAVLAAFLSGSVMFLMGILNAGFLMEFISMPVIKGFTSAAALQIASSQLKSFFGLQGPAGHTFAESMQNFFVNITTMQLWETVLGLSTVIMLILLKKMGKGCKRTDGFSKKLKWFTSLSRNAVVVIVGMIIAYVIKVSQDTEPLTLIGDIGSGLPQFSLPPFGTVAGNQSFNFIEMLEILGPQSIIIPLVSVLETVAIAKAFAVGGRVDATQEMIAVGLCNIIGSFGQSMPVTGSFTRTALNHVSGVKTPAGGIATVLLLFIALTCLTSAFYYIPKATLAGLIITAMYFMFDYEVMSSLWRNSKRELFLMLVTMAVSLLGGLEYGILAGIFIEALLLLYNVAKPTIEVNTVMREKGDVMIIKLCENVSYCAAEYIRQQMVNATSEIVTNIPIIIDGTNVKKLDFSAAFSLMSIVKDLDQNHQVILFNFDVHLKKRCLDIDPRFEAKFMYAPNPLELADVFAKDV